MKSLVFLLSLSCLFGIGFGHAEETYVLPVIADSVPGLYGSLWDSQIRIAKVVLTDSVVLRRKWVCLRDGGFVDDPDTAPSWELPWSGDGYIYESDSIILGAEDLLQGTGAQIGAVAITVEGGEVVVGASIVDLKLGGTIPHGPRPFGIGQTYQAHRESLQGASHIPWIGGCYGESSLFDACDGHYRNNIGLINPNPEPLKVTLWPLPFLTVRLQADDLYDAPSYTIPPYGWLQIPVPLNRKYWSFSSSPIGGAPFYPVYAVLNIMPENENPYFAYASVVYTPLPETSAEQFSEPYFQHAQSGYVQDYADIEIPEP